VVSLMLQQFLKQLDEKCQSMVNHPDFPETMETGIHKNVPDCAEWPSPEKGSPAPSIMLQKPQLIARSGLYLPEPIDLTIMTHSNCSNVTDFADEHCGTFDVIRSQVNEQLLLNKVNMGYIYMKGGPDLVVCAAVNEYYHPDGHIRVHFQIVDDEGGALWIPKIPLDEVRKITIVAKLRNTAHMLQYINPDGSYHSDSINMLVDNLRADRKHALEKCWLSTYLRLYLKIKTH